MAFERLRSLVRVQLFYLGALLLLLFLGGLLQGSLGLPGVVLLQLIIFLGLPLLFTRFVERQPLRPFLRLRMLTFKGLGKATLLGVVGWFMAQLLATVIILVLTLMGGTMVQPYDILLNAPSGLALFAGALIPAFCEEFSFRGYVLGALRPLGPTVAVLLTGLLFGALHLSLIRLLPLTLLGILWALSVQRSGSILPGMIMHLLNNGIALGLSFFVQGQANPADLSAMEQMGEGGIWVAIGTVGMMALVAVAVAFYLATRFGPQDLLRPEAVEAEEQPALPVEAEVASESQPYAPSADLIALQAELGRLQKRRRLMLLATSLFVGLLTLGLYLFAAWQEILMAFA